MLDSLVKRPKGRRIAPLLDGLSGGRIARCPPSWQQGFFPHKLWEPELRELRVEQSPYGRATEALYGRLNEQDVEEVEGRLVGSDLELWNRVEPLNRKPYVLAFGVHYGVESVIEKTGLSTAMPPKDVHVMSTVSTDAGGAYYYSDLVDEALTDAGVNLAEATGLEGLDFGCSSGRVVRVLTCAFPDTTWSGCDPNPTGVRWAAEHLKGIEFKISEQEPPLPYEDGSFDFVFAISIWSHFAEGAALRWFEEIRRILRPDGKLIFTVQGWNTIHHLAREQLWSRDDLMYAARDMYADGFHFHAVYAESGDEGIHHPEWGMAFQAPDWTLYNLCPHWKILSFKPGRAEINQDVVVVERR